MATKIFLAAQVNRLERHTITVTAVAAGGIIGIQINSKVVQYVCTASDTLATAAEGLASAIRNAIDPEFRQMTVAVDSTVTAQINVDANTPGMFISADGNTAFTEVESGGATITAAVAQSGKSPMDGGDVTNWSGAALPANAGDTWYFDTALFPMLYRANTAFTGKSASAIYVRETFSGAGIGMPKLNPAGYNEYLSGRLTVTAATILDIRLPPQSQFESFRFDVGSAQCALTVRGDGSGQIGQEAVEWIGTHASNTVEVYGGSVRICPYVGDVATVNTMNAVGGAITIGSGGTIGTVQLQDSGMETWSNITTVTLTGDNKSSVLALRETAAVTTLTVTSGSVIHSSSGNITTLVVGPGASIDFSGSDDPITITNLVQLHTGARFWDPNGRVTLSAGYTTVQCNASDVTVNFGPGRTYDVT